jgi:FkbM family methyltransferase
MLKRLFKKLRKFSFLNKPVAFIARSMGLKAIQRRWPLSGIYKLKIGKTNFRFYSDGDDHYASHIYYKGFEEKKEMEKFLEYAKTSGVVFDIGANAGIYSLLSASANPAAIVHSFEPNTFNFTRLQKNIALNGYNIVANKTAVGSNSEKLQFAVPKDQRLISYTSSANFDYIMITHRGEIEWEKVFVDCITIDGYCEKHGIKTIDLIKIDVEGHEEEVLLGAVNTLRRSNTVIMCEIFFGEEKTKFFSGFLGEIGYNINCIDDSGKLQSIDLSKEIDPEKITNFFLLPAKPLNKTAV